MRRKFRAVTFWIDQICINQKDETERGQQVQYLSLYNILLQKSTNPEDPHADFAALYLRKGLDTSPIGFITNLLKDNINKGIKQGKLYVIVNGFPRSV
jgi:hypothetical protein